MTQTASTPKAGDKLDAAVLRIAAVVVLGVLMSILDITVVSVALPTFQSVFDTSYSTAAWTMTAYTLALATVIPLTGWAADRFGTKRLYMLALVLFVAGSVLCSTAWDITSLIGFRVLQGLGGGMLMPLGMTILTRTAGPARIGRLMAVLGVPMLLGPIGGPILGGWMIESFSWHWIFLINVPIGVVGFIAAAAILPKDSPTPSESFDFVGMLLMSPGLALFLYGVSSIPGEGTVIATKVLVPAAVGVVLIAAFVRHAFKPEHPLIDLRLFKNRQLTVAVITMFVFAVAFFGAMLLIPSYFLQVRGETTLQAGLLMAPQGLGAMLTMPIAGKLVDKTGPGRIVLFGLVLVAAGMGSLSQVEADTEYRIVLGTLFVMGMGMGATMMPTMTAALQTLTDHVIARGSTLMNIVQQVASSIGTATMSVVLTNQLADSKLAGAAIAAQEDPSVAAKLPPGAFAKGVTEAGSGFATTFTVAFALVLVAFVPAFFLSRRKRAEVVAEADTEYAEGPEDTAYAEGTAYATDTHAAASETMTPNGADPAPVGEGPEGGAGTKTTRIPVVAMAGAENPSADLNGDLVTARHQVTSGDLDEWPVAGLSADDAPLHSRGGQIRGRVHRSGGEGIAAATLTLIDQSGRQVGRGTAGADGAYRVDTPGSGTFVLIASAGSHQPEASTVVVMDDPVDVDVLLTGTAGLAGTVTRAGRAPLADATVTLADERGEVVGSQITGDDGAYRFAELVAGSYTLVVSALASRPTARTVAVPCTGQARQDVDLEGEARLRGVTRTAHGGLPVTDARITLLDSASNVVAVTDTDEAGEYSFGHLDEGEYTVVARGYPPVASTLHVVYGEDDRHDIELGHPGP